MPLDDAGPPAPLSERLRGDTAAAHAALEAELDLLHDLTRPRLVRVLQRFAGFHAGWEPAVARLLDEPALFEPRRRLPALHADLLRLGAAPDGEAWPVAPWMDGPAAAWGSLYVMEGSTLGGQVIGRALRAAGIDGLSYFDGRGRNAGRLWRELRGRLDARPEPERVSAAAIATFEALRGWMRPGAGRPERLGGHGRTCLADEIAPSWPR